MSTPATRRPTRRGRRTGTLVVIAALLAASGTIRLSVGVAEALVRDGGADTETAAVAQQPQIGPEAAGIGPLLEALREREARVESRESALEERLQALALAERRLLAQQAELTRIEAALAATLTLADRAAEEDLLRLTTVYETMKPKEAAILFEEMDPSFAAGFLARMRPDAAAGVMAGMSPRAAYTLSVILAGRNTGVPTE